MTILVYIILMVCGIIHGAREYTHKDPKVFEKLWNVLPTSFWGSESWKRKYKQYPINLMPKNDLISIFPYNDFWHLSHYIKQTLFIIGCVLLGRMDTDYFDFTNSLIYPVVAALVILVFWGGLTFYLISSSLKKKKKKTY